MGLGREDGEPSTGSSPGRTASFDWHLVDDELHTHVNDELRRMSASLDGRVRYELMAELWPTADRDPGSSPSMVEFAGIWRDMPELVCSTTLQGAEWNTTVVRDVVPEDVRALKAQPGGNTALGGAVLAAAFQRHGLIDGYRLYVHPVVLEGRPATRRGSRAGVDARDVPRRRAPVR